MPLYNDYVSELQLHFYWGGIAASEVQFIIMVGHSGMQADLVMEQELRVLHLELHAAGCELKIISINKATPPNSVTPYRPTGVIFF